MSAPETLAPVGMNGAMNADRRIPRRRHGANRTQGPLRAVMRRRGRGVTPWDGSAGAASGAVLRTSLRGSVDQRPRWRPWHALGKDITGETRVIDLTATPHLLIAGATGAGESVRRATARGPLAGACGRSAG